MMNEPFRLSLSKELDNYHTEKYFIFVGSERREDRWRSDFNSHRTASNESSRLTKLPCLPGPMQAT